MFRNQKKPYGRETVGVLKASNALLHLERRVLAFTGENSCKASAYLAEELCSKFFSEDFDPQDTRDAAISKWLRMEERNASTNIRLFLRDDSTPFLERCQRVIGRARGYILGLIGSTPDVSWVFQPTSGSSTRVKRSATAPFKKLEGKIHITQRAYPVWLDAISDTILSDHEGMVYPEFVDHSVMFTVPKNSTIDRVACKEPEANMLLQRSIGLHLRKRLRRIGIDLHDQSRNREGARLASASGTHATVDLSSASDTISDELVRQLLPELWFDLMDAVRVHQTDIDGEIHPLEMFSSMGNGFTFELETLIFWALASATQKELKMSGRILVYGDDIILSSRATPFFLQVMLYLGFIPNRKKTHTKGFFRESCGGHYFKGLDITPVYYRRRPKHLSELISFLNQLRRWLGRHPWTPSFEYLYDIWQRGRGLVPTALHGGRDYASTGSLVTGDSTPRFELIQVPLRISDTRPEMGGFLYAIASPSRVIEDDLEIKRLKEFSSEMKEFLNTTTSGRSRASHGYYLGWLKRKSSHRKWYSEPALLWNELLDSEVDPEVVQKNTP